MTFNLLEQDSKIENESQKENTKNTFRKSHISVQFQCKHMLFLILKCLYSFKLLKTTCQLIAVPAGWGIHLKHLSSHQHYISTV